MKNQPNQKRSDKHDYLHQLDLVRYKKICNMLDKGMTPSEISLELSVETRHVIDARHFYEQFKNSKRTKGVKELCPTCGTVLSTSKKK